MGTINVRFIERDFIFSRIQYNSPNLTFQQALDIVDGLGQLEDLTFKFYDSGKCVIIDNNSEKEIKPSDLKGHSLDFYVRKRIEMIRGKLEKSA